MRTGSLQIRRLEHKGLTCNRRRSQCRRELTVVETFSSGLTDHDEILLRRQREMPRGNPGTSAKGWRRATSHRRSPVARSRAVTRCPESSTNSKSPTAWTDTMPCPVCQTSRLIVHEGSRGRSLGSGEGARTTRASNKTWSMRSDPGAECRQRARVVGPIRGAVTISWERLSPDPDPSPLECFA